MIAVARHSHTSTTAFGFGNAPISIGVHFGLVVAVRL